MKKKNSGKSSDKLFKATSKYLSSLAENDFTFMFKCRSNPSAAFAEIHRNFFKVVKENKRLANEFSKFMKNFNGVAMTKKDTAILADLRKRHGDFKTEIKIGSLPSQLGPGLALMYDAALETLRSSDPQIMTYIFDARAIGLIEKSFSSFLSLIGSASVTAYKLALNDKDFLDKLILRGNEIRTMYLYSPPDIGCDHCVITVEEDDIIIDSYCGTEEECNAMGWLFILLFLIYGLVALIKWLWPD